MNNGQCGRTVPPLRDGGRGFRFRPRPFRLLTSGGNTEDVSVSPVPLTDKVEMGRYTVCISLLVCMIQCGGGDRADDIMLESELALRAMLAQVTPLMELLQTPHRIIAKRSADGETAEAVEPGAEPEGRAIRRRPGLQQHLQDRPSDRYGNGYNDGFGEYASASGSYGYGGGGGYQSYGCCNQKKDELLPILALVALSLLLLYLIALATTTTAAAGGGGRRRRDIGIIRLFDK